MGKNFSIAFALPEADGVLPALVTHGHVAIVAAQQDLVTFGDHTTVFVHTGIDGGFGSAGANGFDLGNGVGNLK